MRFDQVELQTTRNLISEPAATVVLDDPPVPRAGATLWHRFLALTTDLSLFAALALALAPLLPDPTRWPHYLALAGFVTLVSYYYFVGTWLLWGKTIGGTIFDVRVVPNGAAAMSLAEASWRWAGFMASLLTAGLGFAMAILPSRLSLADRISQTHTR